MGYEYLCCCLSNRALSLELNQSLSTYDIQETIRRAQQYGVEVKMITGDHLLIATETAKLLNLGDKVPGSDVVLPIIRTAVGKLSSSYLIVGVPCVRFCYVFDT